MADSSTENLLEVRDLVVEFQTSRGAARGERHVLRAVDRISFSIARGKTLGIVGESGCGKSVTALSIMRLISAPGRVLGGPIRYEGKNLLDLEERELREIRGNKISMIFQEPMTSLNPVYTTGEQVAEAVRLHQGKSRKEAMDIAVEMFRLVGIPSPAERVRNYPHQMSGGMRQRVMIAMALACKPDLLIADEPTTALDVTIQAQILELLRELQDKMGMSMMLITHDLGVVAETCQDVVVMYAGRIVEHSPVEALFKTPKHPYTAGLLGSVPGAHGGSTGERGRLQEIPGMVPPLHDLPVGCKFQDRCQSVTTECRDSEPELVQIGASLVRCHHPLEESSHA